LAVLAILVVVNAVPGEQRRIWFGAIETAFDEPRGWPFVAVARANEDGATEVRASIVCGDVRLKRDVFDGDYPHFAWDPYAVALNLVVATLLVLNTWLFCGLFLPWLFAQREARRRSAGPTS